MRILLLNPPFYRFQGLQQDYIPLSLLAVGAQLKKEGHIVKIKNLEVDKNLSYKGYHDRSKNFIGYEEGLRTNNEVWEELCEVVEEFKPDKVGITVLSVKYKSAIKIINIIKSYNIPIFIGGPHIMVYPDSFPGDVEVITGEFESRKLSGRIKNLDDLPMPDYDMLLDTYSPNGFSHITSSRGCPFKCEFCASNTVWNRIVTFKSADRIIREMTDIYNRFKNTSFTFWDETFTINKKRLKDFCSKYKLNVPWNCDTRADVLDDDSIKMIKESGCQHVSLGVESGRPHILKRINKGETIDDFIRASGLLNKYGVQWKSYCIIGFPEEDESDILETIRFIKSLKPFRITLSFFTPYKGTGLYEDCLKKGLIDKNYDASLFAHQSPHNYFCPKIKKERYDELKDIISDEIDEYNKNAIKTWV